MAHYDELVELARYIGLYTIMLSPLVYGVLLKKRGGR